jgi:UDP-N-acetylmuramate dehydrogenase
LTLSDAAGPVLLAEHTTLRLGGQAQRFEQASSEDELVTLTRAADSDGEPVLVLGGGSNLVIADEGFGGTVLRVGYGGVRAIRTDGAVELTVGAGEDWDTLVRRCVADGLSGIECLSGIPGVTGATPIQNVNAYGQHVAQTITSVRAYDRAARQVVDLTAAECEFGYRTSMFKRAALDPVAPTGRHVVLSVTFRLADDPLSAPVRYAELARVLAVGEGSRVPLATAREAVLGLRRGKGMVLDPADPDTRSAGSFFTNPVLDAPQFARLKAMVADRFGAARIPAWDEGNGFVKVSAAWLIEQAGFGKGFSDGSAARISTKHTLALVNPGGASTADLIRLARLVRDGVLAAFAVQLVPEPVLVGTKL